jgi:ferrous iron transport protein A
VVVGYCPDRAFESEIIGEILMSTAYATLDLTDGIIERAESLDPPIASLDRLRVGRQARVFAVKGEGAVARRLMEMGVIPGAPVRVVKCAPLGDPLEVRVRNYHLALRRSEAQTISVVLES